MRLLGYLLAGIVLFMALYVGSYYALVERGWRDRMDWGQGVVPKYRIGGEVPENFFSLWHDCDQQLRPHYWSYKGFSETIFERRNH